MRPDGCQRATRRVQNVANRGQLVERDPELRARGPGREMGMGVGRDGRVDSNADPPVAGGQQRIESPERLGVDEGANGERRGEIGIGLADAVDDDPLRIRAGAKGQRQLDRPDDLEADAVRRQPPQERGVRIRLDCVRDERAGERLAPRARARRGERRGQ